MSFLKRWLPVLAWSALILTFSSEQFSASQSGGWFRLVFGTLPPPWLHFLIRKAAHLVAYGILGFLAVRAARVDVRRPVLAALVISALVAVIDETHQSTTATRTGSPWDVLLDLVGAGLAITFTRPFRKEP